MRTAHYIRNLQNCRLTVDARVDRIIDKIENLVLEDEHTNSITVPVEKNTVAELLRHLDFKVTYLRFTPSKDNGIFMFYDLETNDYKDEMVNGNEKWVMKVSW